MKKRQKTYKVKAQRSLYPTTDTILVYSKCGMIPPTELPAHGALNFAIGDREKAYFECRIENDKLVLIRELKRQTW